MIKHCKEFTIDDVAAILASAVASKVGLRQWDGEVKWLYDKDGRFERANVCVWRSENDASAQDDVTCPTCGLPHPLTNPYCFCREGKT